MSARSMTGFARVRRPLGQGEITVTVKTVNHRALDVHLHLPPELDICENVARAAIKRRVRRGHVQAQVRLSGVEAAAPAVLNTRFLEAYLAAFHQAAASFVLTDQPDLNAALRVPGMLEAAQAQAEPDPETEAALLAALAEALDRLDEFRRREGAEITALMRGWNQTVKEQAAGMKELRARAAPAFEARLSERLSQLLANAPLDPQRLAQEAAFLADRSDIAEELTRLEVHAAQVESLLAEDGEVGKKLDFLLQEMQRETNTILAKAAGELGLPITQLALGAKSEIEKMREQVGNLE